MRAAGGVDDMMHYLDALFSIVNFPNDACTTDSGDTGMCVASR